jgi:HAD superfamily hydrolase (TIGR01459 family)
MRHLAGLRDTAPDYDGFIIDIWGVLHDGVTVYPGAIDCLQNLAGRPVVLLSNAPRRAHVARAVLENLGIGATLYAALVTSGEATWSALHLRNDPWFAALGDTVWHIGPLRDRSVIEGLPLRLAQAPSDATFVLNTGPDETRIPTSMAPFEAELQACLDARLPMICANPDIAIIQAGTRILCAGAFAAWYQARGGSVRLIGKPDAAIFTEAMHAAGLAGKRVLVIGDSLTTDIAGALAAGLDSAWVLGGLYEAQTGSDFTRAEQVAREAGTVPNAALPRLVW